MSKNNYKILRAPSLGVNDEIATIVEWFYKEGKKVQKDDLLCVAETTKTAFDIISEHEGYLIILKEAEIEVKTGEPVALIADEKKEIEIIKKNYIIENKKNKSANVKITKKAKELALAHNINIDGLHLSKERIICEKDIQEQIKKDKSKLIPKYKISLVGKINKSFLKGIETDEKFPFLQSEEKIKQFRENGAIIEDDVEIGSGSIILSDYIYLKKKSKICSDCYIKSSSFELGEMSVIGNKANIVTRHVKIGDVFFSGNSIIVGGGRAFSSRSKLIVGDECLISSSCTLNTGEGIIIGNRVGLSPNVKLYTHNHWQSELDGYHSNFGPIIIEDNVYITGDCLVVPNVTIEKGSTVFANSTVTSDVKAYTQLSGNPAVVVGKINTNITQNKKISIIKRMLSSMYKEQQRVNINEKNVTYLDSVNSKTNTEASVIITFNVEKKFKPRKGKIVFNLDTYEIRGDQDSLSDEVRNFFRRRGIRFKPIHWRYADDEMFYNG